MRVERVEHLALVVDALLTNTLALRLIYFRSTRKRGRSTGSFRSTVR